MFIIIPKFIFYFMKQEYNLTILNSGTMLDIHEINTKQLTGIIL